MKTIKLTEEEKELVAKEMAERCKDVVYMHAHAQCRDTLNWVLKEDVSDIMEQWGDEIVFDYKIHMLIGDVMQVLGRHRRNK